MMRATVQSAVLLILILFTPAATAAEPPLAHYYGFEPLEVMRIGRDAGPILVADMDGDGRNDVIVVNNFASRIEVHRQRRNPDPDRVVASPSRVNEFPEHWRFQRETIPVAHRVQAIIAHDFDGDGRLDLIYAGQPSEIVFLRQNAPGEFQIARQHRVRNLAPGRDGLKLADLIGDDRPELISIVNGELHLWTMNGDQLAPPYRLSAGGNIASFRIADFSGDGVMDVAAMVPDDAAPIRMWLGQSGGLRAGLGPQLRFEMPALREMETVQLPNEAAARLAVLESASRRLVVYTLATESLEQAGSRDAAYHVFSFTDPGNRERDVIVTDLDGDGLLDVAATDTQASAIAIYRQARSRGLLAPELHPSLSDMTMIAAKRIGDATFADVFALSEKEGVVGRSRFGPGGLPFPQPLGLPEGATPVAMNLVELGGELKVAVIAKSGRDHSVELLDLEGGRQSISIGSQTRSPETILAIDADQDGRRDLLLFTRDRPMIMLRADEEGFTVVESKDMGQFGLVQAARSENTVAFDMDGSGQEELLIADRNYVRAVKYVAEPPAGVSPGWQVVAQINASDPASRLVSLTTLNDRIVAADRANGRLIMMDRDATDGEAASAGWREAASIDVRGFTFGAIHGGSFDGAGGASVLAIGDDGFAVIRLAGERMVLQQTDAWRSGHEIHLHHRLAAGNLNSDGFTDLIALDSGEQLCEIFTFTETGVLLHATSFKVFESKIFSGGTSREFQPTQAVIADVTGDGANDLILVAHDRVLLYPQMILAEE